MSSSDSRRMIAVIGGIVALGIGGVLYFVLVFQPARQRETAQAQIREWEPRWHAARTCLLGDAPLAADAADAITAREIVAGTTEAAMGDCTKLVGGLTRPPGASSGVAAVEDAWPLLEVAIGELAQAYAAHRARPLADDNPLPAALDQLRDAHATLRAAAGLGAPPAIEAPAAAPLVPEPLVLDGGSVAELGGVTVDGVLRGIANVSGRPGAYDITWSASGLTGAPSAGAIAALPDRSWTLRVEPSADGAVLRAGDVQVVRTGTGVAPLVALGAAAGRLALYATPDGLDLARSADGGATWATGAALPAPPRGEVAWGASATGDRLFLAWAGDDHLMLLALSPDAHATGPLPAPVALAAQSLQTWCTGGALWIVGGTPTGYQVWKNGEGPGTPLTVSQPLATACDGERLVLRATTGDTAAEHACTASACAPLPAAGERDRVVGLAGGHVYRADARDRVVAVWRDAEPPRFFRLPERRSVYGIVDVGGKPTVLLLAPERTALDAAELP